MQTKSETDDFRFRPTFDDGGGALIRGRCALCGCDVTQRVAETKATGLWHCGKPWASFDGLEIEYSDAPSQPRPTRSPR